MILSSACGVVGLHPIFVGVRLVVRLHKQVRRVLHIEEHRGCSGTVLVPGDEVNIDNNIKTDANDHLQVTSPVSV